MLRFDTAFDKLLERIQNIVANLCEVEYYRADE